jgi:hypothetical protein
VFFFLEPGDSFEGGLRLLPEIRPAFLGDISLIVDAMR